MICAQGQDEVPLRGRAGPGHLGPQRLGDLDDEHGLGRGLGLLDLEVFLAFAERLLALLESVHASIHADRAGSQAADALPDQFQFTGQFLGARDRTVGDDDPPDAVLGEVACRELDGLAGTDQQGTLVRQVAEDLARETDRGKGHLHRL